MASVTPAIVLYCKQCGMPPEYCSYGPDYETHCLPWLTKNFPHLLPKATEEVDNSASSNSASSNSASSNSASTSTEAALTPWSSRDRLFNFYSKYVPAKISSTSPYEEVDKLLVKYAGKEENLFVALTRKYGDEPVDPYLLQKYGAASGSDSDSDSDGDGGGGEEDGEEGGEVLVKKMSGLRVAQKAAAEKVAGGEGDASSSSSSSSSSSKKLKARGVAAKSVAKQDTRIVISKNVRNKKKAVTHVIGLSTFDHPTMKLKDMAKAFAKRFAGSSSVKEEEIIIQGDHVEDVAEMIVSKFKCKRENVFLDVDGKFVAF